MQLHAFLVQNTFTFIPFSLEAEVALLRTAIVICDKSKPLMTLVLY